MAPQQLAGLTRGVEQQPAPEPGHLDVEAAKPAREGCRRGRDHDQTVIAVDETGEVAQDRKHRTVVEQVCVIDEHREVGPLPTQPDELVDLLGLDEGRGGGPRHSTCCLPSRRDESHGMPCGAE